MRQVPVTNILLATAIAVALASPVAAQNLLERSVSPPTYESPPERSIVLPPFEPSPSSAELPPVPGVAPAPPPGTIPPAAPGQPSPGANPTQPGTTGAEEPAPPYEPQLLRLSELLGALTYLQNLCGGQKGDIWRDKMTALMDAETQNETRRERLAGAYNRGFEGYELNYRQCTPNAQAIITRFLDESSRIARDVSLRYGTS
jgi:uncharacterized protein (TIGR02301 family)